MNSKFLVHLAARENNFMQLQTILSGKSAAEIEELAMSVVNNCTPLVMSCRNGHYKIAKYLVTECNVNVEQTGTVHFDSKAYEEAPPLWCAAAAGYLRIVKLLVEHGANVNVSTRSKSAPLHAACFDRHLEIVQYLVQHGADPEALNRHGRTCLMIASYRRDFTTVEYLLSLNVDVNRTSRKGSTALHYSIDSNSMEVLLLLLEHGAHMLEDSYGMTPVLSAAANGHFSILKHLTMLPGVSRENYIDALELLGATCVDKKRDFVSAIKYWREAMEIRNEEPEIPKLIQAPIAAYEYVTEFTTMEALDELIADHDEMRMQALVIRQRIFGAIHPDTTYYIRSRGAAYADTGRYDRCIALWMHALTMQQKVLQPLSVLNQYLFRSFIDLFNEMLPHGRPVTEVVGEKILVVFKKSVVEVERGIELLMEKMNNPVLKLDATEFDRDETDEKALSRALISALRVACFLSSQMDEPTFSPVIRHEFLGTLYKLNKLNLQMRYGRSSLHYAYFDARLPVDRPLLCQCPSLSLAKALLEVGADPNVIDIDGNTPLHLILWTPPCSSEILKGLSLSLLENGAHLDVRNNEGETFESMLKPDNIRTLFNPLKYTSLACLAARTIVEYDLEYKDVVPESLHSFIEMH